MPFDSNHIYFTNPPSSATLRATDGPFGPTLRPRDRLKNFKYWI